MYLWNVYLDHPRRELAGLIVVYSLVEIDRVDLIICKFSYFTILVENAYSRPQNGFLGNLTLVQFQQ